jgi:hypothetical protein
MTVERSPGDIFLEQLAAKPTPKTASEICVEAAKLVNGDRSSTHGDSVQNHKAIADVWNGYLMARARITEVELDAHDVANMMELLKVARRLTGAFNPDDYIDGAGYAAVAGEIRSRQYD